MDEEVEEMIIFITNVMMKNELPNEDQVKYIMESFPKNKKILVNNYCVFEVIENNGNTLTIKPLGTNSIAKQRRFIDKEIETTRFH